MNTMNKLTKILLGIAAVALFCLSSCGDDDGPPPTPDAPQLAFDVEDFDLSRGDSREVTISIQAPGGLATLTAAGDALEFAAGSVENVFTATLDVSAEVTEATGAESIEVVATDEEGQTATDNLDYTVIGQLIEYENTVITADETWLEGNVYRLSDDLDIDGATLTIEEGVVVQLEVTDDGAGGFIDHIGIGTDDADESGNEGTGTLIINGTAENPVVFTPNSDSPQPGMWSGIRIRGGSGHVFNYVRIEYAGVVEGDDTDDWALRLDDVTSADIDYVQIHSPLAGAIRLNGGTFDMSHIVINNTNPGDYGDGHAIYARDGDNGGYVGNIQFLILNNPQGSHGEREVLADAGSDALSPVSITFANVTAIGSGSDFEDPEEPGELASLDFTRLRRDGVFRIYNSIIAEYPDDGIRRSGVPAEGSDDCQYNYIFNIGGYGDDGLADFPNPANAAEFSNAIREDWASFGAEEFNNEIDPSSTLIPGISPGDYTPDATVSSEFDPSSLGSFFDAATYVGAIGDTDWTVGWTLNADGSERQ